jgi:PAS domain S-box-containing protein
MICPEAHRASPFLAQPKEWPRLMINEEDIKSPAHPRADSCSAAAPRSGDLVAEVEALARLNEASSRLWHLSNLEEGLQEILRSAIALLGGDKGNVQLLGADGLLRLAAHDRFEQPFIDVFREVSPDGAACCGRALRTGERVIIEDVNADEQFAPLREVAREAGYRAVQSTPIVSCDGRKLGMISTHFRSPHRPNEQRLRLLDLYVRQAADFIDRCGREERLRESEQRLQALSDIAPATMLWASAPEGGCTFISRGWYEYTGRSAAESIGMGWLAAVHAEDRERIGLATREAKAARQPFALDHRLQRADGGFRWVQSAGRPRLGANGEFLGFVGSVVDIHERKLAEQALRRSEAIQAGQKEAFQAATNGRPLADCLNALVRTAVEHYGDARAAFHLTGEGRPDLQHAAGMDEGSCWSFPVQTQDGPVLGTFALHFPQLRKPARDDLNLVGALTHAAAIIISKYAETADRARAEQALKDANRRKDEFLAVLGHELRNPLAPLSTAADLLHQAGKRPDLLETVRPLMRRQIDHLTRLVDDLLDVSRISRGHAALQRAPLDVRSAIESAVEQSEPLIAQRRHRLTVELGNEPLRADGDFQRLTQVFVNLLSNAARYSEPGNEIAVRAARSGDEVIVAVSDRGFGIPPNRMQEVFEMFSQVPEHRSLIGGGGLGIGLALCRQLVQLHGGSIAVKSDGLGTGSEFVVRLPLAPAARAAAEAPAASTERGAPPRRVLVVDDNEDAATLLSTVLELQGHEVRAVFDGPTALEALAHRETEVVLLDLGMPSMDGFEVARRLRALPNGRDVLLVALTGWGQDHDRMRTADAGFDVHLTKPVDIARLSALLAQGRCRATNSRFSPNP